MPHCQPAVNYWHPRLICSSFSLPCRVALRCLAGCSCVSWIDLWIRLLSFGISISWRWASFVLPYLNHCSFQLIHNTQYDFRGFFLQAASWEKYRWARRWDGAIWASFTEVHYDLEGNHWGLCANRPSEVQECCLFSISVPHSKNKLRWCIFIIRELIRGLLKIKQQ